jgi:hypothetical protein
VGVSQGYGSAMAAASVIIAVVALIIALASAAYTRRQAVAAEGATAIENQRRHGELTPEIAVTCEERPGSRLADMTLELTGPDGLDRLDEVTVRIRDDIPDRKPSPGSQLTQDQISEVIWGPYRFNTGQRDTGQHGRSHGPFSLPRHEPYPLSLEQSIPPSWTGPSWRTQYEDKPVRLEITCRREGHTPWVLRCEAGVKPDPASQVM